MIARRPATADEVAVWVREVHGSAVPKDKRGQGGQNGQSGPSIKSTSSTKSTIRPAYAEAAANAALVLIAVACSLLDRQLAAQAAAFERDGGFTERLYRIRRQRRGGDDL